tara:strand:- start:1417 stop:2382 length:966 start_codon:yes stop_codon:yes gene_type:complete
MAEQQTLTPKDKTPKVMMSRSGAYKNRQSRMKRDEEELNKLMKGNVSDETETTEQEEPSSEITEDSEVQATDDTKQEETTTEAVEASQEDESELSSEEKSFKKRYGDLRRHMGDKEKEWSSRISELEDKLEGKTVRAPKSNEDIEAWAAKYPDVASIVETIASKKAEEKFASADQRLRELDEAKYEVSKATAEAKIRKAHEDFDELKAADSFHTWVDEQPKWVQDALYENEDDPRSVIRVIDLYKSDKGLTTSAKKTKLKEAAADVSKGSRSSIDATDSSRQIKESDIKKMTDKQFEDNLDNILEAQRSGRFIYDITHRNR